jgi:hypothetical protein
MLKDTAMASANTGMGKSGSYLVDLSSADDLWRKLADTTPVPTAAVQANAQLQRVSRRSARPPQFAGMETTAGGTFQKIKAVQTKSAGFVENAWDKVASNKTGSVEMPADPWSSSERRLWFVAGGLMALAVAVLTLFAMVTFTPGHSLLASAATSPALVVPGVMEPAPVAAPATHDANTFRPPLPARVRVEAPKASSTVARNKHTTKQHKGKRSARN